MRKNDFDRIERYIKGLSDESEKEDIESLFCNGENNLYFRNRIYEDWNLLKDDDSTPEIEGKLNNILDRIHHIIRKRDSIEKRKPFRRFINFYIKAAAILLVPLFIGGGILFYNLSYRYRSIADSNGSFSIYAPLGSRLSFDLPDGTKGMLNSGSYLRYSLPFSRNRIINLEGEAWFEVKHDEKNAFKIVTGNSIVNVFGTSFNLSAYSAEDYVEIVLVDGKVEYLNNETEESTILLPSERLINKRGKTTKSFVDPEKYNSWTEGKLIFRGDSMAEVARRLERWYNVRIILADKEIENYKFRATFEDDNLNEVLKFLAMTSPITYKILPRQLLPDGSFSKEKVIINKLNY